MPSIASLIVRIGAQDQEIQNALASIGQKARSVDADLKKLGGSPLAGGAQKSLESLRSTMQQITEAQQRVAERGQLAAKGLEAMGGASKLTDAQLKQVNRTLQDGISAFHALGKEAPEELRKVADSVKNSLDSPLGLAQTKIIALGTAIGNFVGTAIVGFGRDLVQAGKAAFVYADALTNLSVSTGITVEGLQRIEALGVTSGISMDTLAGSVEQLQKHLNDPAAIKALNDMGQNYERIRALKPEEQFLEIAQSVAAIEDPVDRANAGAALFGRQWSTIAPAIQGDIKKIVDGVDVLSAKQIKAIDDAGDALDRFQKQSERTATRVVANTLLMIEKYNLLASPAGPLGQAIALIARGDAAVARAEALAKAGAIPVVGAPRNPFLPAPLQTFEGSNIGSGKLFGQTLEEQATAADKAAAAVERFRTVQDQLFGRAVIAHAEELLDALGSTDNLTKLTEASTKKLRSELVQALEVYRALGKEVPPKLQQILDLTTTLGSRAIAGIRGRVSAPIGAQTFDEFPTLPSTPFGGLGTGPASLTPMLQGVRDVKVSLDDLSSAFAHLALVSGGTFGEVVRDIGTAISSMQLAIASVKTLQQGIANLGKSGSRTQGALQVAGGIAGGVGAIAQATNEGGIASRAGKGALSGAALGAQIGTFVLPVIGTAAGAIIGGIAGAIVGAWRGIAAKIRKEMQVNPIRADWFLQPGHELENLNPVVLELTGNLKAVQAVFDARNPEQYGAAIERLNAILEEGKRRFEELREAVGTIGTKLSGITTITPAIKSALETVFDASTTAGYLSALERLNGELDKQAAKYKDIEDTLKKYGLGINQAGKEFQQAKINEAAVTLKDDFQTLVDAGVDINAQMRAMGPSIRSFIKDAQAAGVEVPRSMQQVIQTAIDAGEVYDDNGNKITNMSDLGLTFGDTMQDVVKDIEGAMDRLVLVLEGLAKFLGIDLPKAADDGADGVNDALAGIKNPKVTLEVDTSQFPEGFLRKNEFGEGVEGFASGSHGFRDFGAGQLAVLHGREAVVTEGELTRLMQGRDRNTQPVVFAPQIHFNGSVLAEREYIERTVVGPVLDGIERNYLARFGRLGRMAER